jgi:ABC-type lipoprotein export system ATPase subunit
MPLALRGVPARERALRVDELLLATGVSDCAAAIPEELSGGERQRVALCVALAHRPALLLADEPTGELDAASAAAIRALIADLVREHGTSAIVVSHDPATGAIADRTVEIRDGRVVEEQSSDGRALVIDRRGWMRLPDYMLTEAGIGGRARVALGPGGLVLTAADEHASPEHWVNAPSADDSVEPREPARVELHAVTRSYRQGQTARRVLDALTHAFPPGRVTVVAGPSGTGKSTLLRLLVGLDRPSEGEVLLDGEPLSGLDGDALAALRRERIGYLPQQPSPVGFLSAFENVVLALRLRGSSASDAEVHAERALAEVGLADRAMQRVSRLSAGEGQRVALARALASARGLLVVDEPTSRLDEAGTRAVGALLAAAAAEGHTVICATHDPVLVRQADGVLELGASQVAAVAAR